MIGDNIAEARQDAGLSQAELSERLREVGLNWSQGTLSKVESGSRPVRLSEAPIVASVLGTSLQQLLEPADYLDRRGTPLDQDVVNEKNRLELVERGLREKIMRSAANHLFVELRSGADGPYLVHGCSPHSLIDFTVDAYTTAAGHYETAALARSLGLQAEVNEIERTAKADVSAWLDDVEQVPRGMIDDYDVDDNPAYVEIWAGTRMTAKWGDIDSLIEIEDEAAHNRLVELLTRYLLDRAVQFIPPFGHDPRAIDGLRTWPPSEWAEMGIETPHAT